MNSSSSNQRIQTIVKAIKKEEQLLRARHPLLAHQNTIALTLLVVSLSAMVGVGFLYFLALIPAWLTIVLAAFFASISHELEHDLIHKQYFNKQPIMHNMMMLVVWLMRPNTINPWARRVMHLNHHKVSGTHQDLEERLVGNGIKNPLLRFIVIVDGLLGLLIFQKRFSAEIKGFRFLRLFNAGFPITTCYFAVLYSFIVFHAVDFATAGQLAYPTYLLGIMDWVNFLMVVLIAPNIVRSACLNFVTSSMHYYGGVTNVLQQTYVLNHWLFAPFQWFCFNFGHTHTIHHFIPNQPFYIRQWISNKIIPVMLKNGVHHNDLASLKQANYYHHTSN